MRVLLFVMAILAAGVGLLTEAFAKTVTHEILGGVFFVCAAVLLIGAAIVDAIVQLPERLGTIRSTTVDAPDAPREAAINEKALDVLINSGALRRR